MRHGLSIVHGAWVPAFAGTTTVESRTLLPEQRQRLFGQHATGDRDRGKALLLRNLRARHHDLIDLGGELRHRRVGQRVLYLGEWVLTWLAGVGGEHV